MDIFTQKKLLVRIVFLLTLLNIFLISMFLWWVFIHQQPQPKKERDVSNVLEKELNLNKKQVEQIKNLRAAFLVKEKVLSQIIRDERDSMNIAMFSKSTVDNLVKSLARNIAENEYKMELLRFDQSKELKTYCTEVQLEKFEKLVLEIRDFFKPENKPKE